MSTRDIEAHLRELHGVSVGRDLVSRVTDAVMDDVRKWQTRTLEDLYPAVKTKGHFNNGAYSVRGRDS